MKKKVISVLLMITMLSLVGCGDKENERVRERESAEEVVTEVVTEPEKDKVEEVITEPEEIEEIPEEIVEETPEEYEYPEVDSSQFEVSKVGSFTTKDLDGNVVTEAVFGNAQYTMINIWGTFCGPCINEMPELQEIYESLPSNMQIIGVVCDLSEDYPESYEDAFDIIDYTGVEYLNIMTCPELENYFSVLQYVPSTLFVDSKGNVVREVIVGADLEQYKSIIKELGR